MSAPRCRDLAYRAGVPLARLDLWGPAESGPLVVWAYGGGLEGGSKDHAETHRVATVLASWGCRVAALDYRLYPSARWPDPVEDLAAACAWAVEACAPVDRWFVGGHSAGAYLAALVGLQRSWLACHGCRAPDGMALISGQMQLHHRVAQELGVEPGPAHPAAPLAQVHAAAPAILAVAAADDLPGRWQQQQDLVAALQALGHHRATALQLPERDHVTLITRLGEAGDPLAPALRQLLLPELSELPA